MIRFSPAALAEIRRLHAKRGEDSAVVSLTVRSGGCADLFYDFDFKPAVEPGDIAVECDRLTVAIAPDSQAYVNGLTVEYSEDLMGGGFRFYNPNAARTCSCGHSFTVES